MVNEVIKKNGISYGVIIGIVSALLTATIYAIDLKLFVSSWVGIVSIAINITLCIVLFINTKKELKGIFTFKEAFTTYFIAAVIGVLISNLFNILLFNIIDPSAKESLNELIIRYTAEMLQNINRPASVINETIEKMRNSNPYNTVGLLKGSAFSIAMHSVFGLLFAAFFKSKTTQELQ